MEPANPIGEDNSGPAGLLAGKDQEWEFNRRRLTNMVFKRWILHLIESKW